MGVSEVRVQGVREGPGADKLDVGRVHEGEAVSEKPKTFEEISKDPVGTICYESMERGGR